MPPNADLVYENISSSPFPARCLKVCPPISTAIATWPTRHSTSAKSLKTPSVQLRNALTENPPTSPHAEGVRGAFWTPVGQNLLRLAMARCSRLQSVDIPPLHTLRVTIPDRFRYTIRGVMNIYFG